VAASPRWRYRRVALRELGALLPWLVLVLVANIVVGRWAGFVVLGIIIVVSTVGLAVTGSSRALRRAGLTFVRLGTGGRPEPWRLVCFRLTPAVLAVPLVAASTTGSSAFYYVSVAAYLGMWVVGLRRAARYGRGLDPMLALTGLDVTWSTAPPTPSGTSGPPAQAPPPPTPAAPATLARAPRRWWTARRLSPR
jgi:hypothetical protein